MRLHEKINCHVLWFTLLIMTIAGLVSSCSNSGSSNSNGVSESGTLSFNKSSISVTNGSAQTVVLSLASTESNIDVSVDIASANSSVASVSPSICSLSNSSTLGSSCKITVRGITNGQTTISAIATGYKSASASVTVSNDQVPGTLSFAYPTTPIYVSESSVAYLSLDGSSGISNDTINLTSSNSQISVSPSSCILSTANNICTIALNATGSASSTITATSVLTGSVTTMQAIASTTPTVGTLNISPASVLIAAQSGSQSLPATIILTQSAGVHNLWVSVLSNSNSSVAQPGNITQNSIPVGNCCLSSNPESNTCNFNAVGQGAIGSTNITWKAVSNGVGSVTCPAMNASPTAYSTVALKASAATIQPTARTITVVNNCSNVIYFGVSGGAVGNSASSQGDCPANSTYVSAKSTCFWNNPAPTNGYTLSANGGSTSISIPASDYKGQQWSGGIAGRTGCTESGLCQTGGCTGAGHGFGGDTGLACTITHGFDIPNSAAEFTLLNNGNDAYDITLIGGVITPLSMQPSNNTTSSTGNPYQCGNAGDAAAQYGFFNGVQQVLYGSNWSPSPTSSVNTAVITPAEAYNFVAGSSVDNLSCSTGSAGSYQPNSSACGSGLTCGYTYDAIFNPSPSYKYTCGARIGWISAATIFAANSDLSNVAPFGFNQAPNPSGSNPNGYTVGAWSQCVNPPFDSSYQSGSPAAQTCGGTNWVGIATPESGFLSSNLTWQQEILSRITWIKQTCPTCYSYQFDDNSSSFTCQTQASTSNPANGTNYTVTFCPK